MPRNLKELRLADLYERDIEEFLNSAKIAFHAQSLGLFDTPSDHWALSIALQRLADKYSELATK